MIKRLVISAVIATAVIAITRPATVSTATDPALVGQWSAPISWPHVGVHAHLLNTGEVVTWQFGSTATVWNPSSGVFNPAANLLTDLLCAGHTFLPDGRLITLGGWSRSGGGLGVADVSVFSPDTKTWTKVASMANPRWYPTGTTLADGRILVTSGDINRLNDIAATPEIYDPAANSWTSMPLANNALPVYPFIFVLPDGRVLSGGSSEVATTTQVLDLATQRWSVLDPVAVDGASAVMFAPGKVLKAGTAADSGNNGLAAKTAFVLDTTKPTPAWTATGSMAFPRSFMVLTALPDGTVLVTGGGSDRSSFNTANAIKPAEIWSPATGAWTTMASMLAPRLYHSTALLLPDARVLVTGGGSDTGVADQLTGEIFSPPYLFKGPRPTIASAPSAIGYGSSFFVGTPDGAGVASASLIAAGSVTHAFNASQRFVPLQFQTTTDGLTISGPANSSLAPPGYYLLFLVSSSGVPSVATFVEVAAGAGPPPPAPSPAPTGLTATVSGSNVTLTWAAPVGGPVVASYNIYRSVSSTFVPSAATLIAQSTATTYVDGGLAAGTYFYRVVAIDSAGNLSTASAAASATIAAPPSTTTLAVDTTVSADGSGQLSTPPFSTTKTGDLLLAFVGSDGTGTQTVTVSGAGLIWTLVARVNVQAGTSEIWKATASGILSGATVTSTQSAGGFHQSLTVVAFSGAAGTGAAGSASAPSGAPTVSLTTTNASSLVYAVGNDWDTATARTPATGQTIVHQYLASVGDTFWVQHAGGPVSAGTVVIVSDTAPTNDQWNFASVEVVAAGPPPVSVPNVIGQTQAAASNAIVAANLTVGTITTASSTTIAAGLVISQSPVAATQVAPGSDVNLTVSAGPPVVVPNVVGLTQAAASNAIVAANLTVGTITTASSTTVAAGLVINQSPVAATEVASGSAVNLTVSSGPPPVPVPNVVGQTQAAASTAIVAANLTVGAITTASSTTVAAGLVISQSPVAATQVAPGSAVNLIVSSGPPPVLVPNVVGQTQAAASNAIVAANLTVGAITTASSTTIAAGLVISQNPVAATEVASGSAVNLTVSSGPPPVAVPDVIGQTQAAASSAIVAANLTVGTVTTASSDTVAAGLVISQTPGAGTLAVGGTRVALVVSTGPSPVVDTVVSADGFGTISTPPFSTSAPNELLVAFASSDGSGRAQALSVSSGSGLSWTFVNRANTQRGSAEIWVAVVPKVLSNIIVRSSQNRTNYHQSLTVVAFAGASGVGASAVNSAPNGSPAVSLTTTKAGSLVYAVGNDPDQAIAWTGNDGEGLVHQYLSPSNATFWVQRLVGSVPVAGTDVLMQETSRIIDQWNFASVEIVP